jgi:hypothetical protein
MQSGTIDHVSEVELLMKNGMLNDGMTYHFDGQAEKFLSLYNRIDDRWLAAEISHNCIRQGEAFTLCITEQIAQGEAQTVSVYEHADIAHLVRTAKGFLCIYSTGGQRAKKAPQISSFTVRADARLHKSFAVASEAYGECPAVVLRQLMRYFVGRGPDPRASLPTPLTSMELLDEKRDESCRHR